MRALLRENVGEAIIGLAVVLLAAWFVMFAWDRTGGGERAGAIRVTALFPNASGVNVGTDVRVAGLKVGTVSAQKLDPQSYQVAVSLALDPSVKLPSDSTAAITSEGLLGSTFIALTPGGSTKPFKNGDTITDTQGAMDLMALIGQFINKPASTGGTAGGAPATP
ncbi:outer membrane lipid asymmetry maintenance protein MlaD [Sphingomonas nostoxanthinifaciens]|uniref:outer membrane lipid asymmetry maintenance protein MlaD n=1 Tax=Sphingomonas nostoxanthinifaciens TaxID=2872652 RepID=UPI001CC20A3E|nr:outer membrane lipid asymmetry maintenance protein MlaD [Sphingomonas nostoxanthinifaciens]UAK24895.1 outer membrane lipid asymmetry maintenance protein MlaD [Sphingomonas nostoxanthinifaciens]